MSCNKTSYQTRDQAHESAKKKNTSNRKNKTGERLREYYCSECRAYHLTSKTIDQFQQHIQSRTAKFIKKESSYWEKKLE